MTKRLTRKAIADAVIERNSIITALELVRDPSGYFYCVGERRVNSRQGNNGDRATESFVTCGIYTYRLDNGWTLDEWCKQVEEVIENA